MHDDCPLTWSLCAGIVMFAATFVVTQVQLWTLESGLKVAAIMGFGTWALIEVGYIAHVAWELWKRERENR